MNCVVLIGRWTKDLELKYLPGNGTAVASGTLAVDKKFVKDGKKECNFIPIVIFGKIAESAANHTGKGKLCGVKGSINLRSYDAKDGSKRFITEIIAEEVQFLEWATSAPSSIGNNDNKGDNEEMTQVEDDGSIPF